MLPKSRERVAKKGLAKLSERQRAVFTLRHYDAYSLDEIAEILKLDTGTVKAHLFRALGKLREELRDLYGTRQGAGAPVKYLLREICSYDVETLDRG